MKNRVLLAFVASVTACAAYAEQVTPAMAMAAADVWAERNAQFGTGNNATNVITVCDTNAAQTVLWHQVSMADGGCLIIAPVTEIEPVVMALERDPGELPAAHPLRGILMLDMRKRLRFLNLYEASASGGKRRLASSSSSVPEEDEEKAAQREAVRQEWAEQQQTKWDRLVPNRKGRPNRLGAGLKQRADNSQMQVMVVLPGFEAGGALTHWNQDGPYAKYTPGNVVCGCVATAAAAMMQYFRVGEKPGQEIKKDQADAGTSYLGSSYPTKTIGGKYDWANPTDELYGRVAFDAGVAVGMSWNVGGSGASEAATATAFTKYFGFKEARCVHNPKPDQYEKLIYAQCRSGAPVGMGFGKSSGGDGHSVVAVGYGIDEDDVERVRVFLGWGGSGDGWYALPYINTKSTFDGDEDLFDILDTVITMIGYENDYVVPVYGRLLPYINPPMTIGGVEYKPSDDDPYFDAIFTDGFFGARVSASGTQANRQVELFCAGKSGSITIGPAASKTESCVSDGDAICKWVPDPIFFPLLNSEVALSFADARQKCIDSFSTPTNKPVFAFSGKWGEPATDAAWDYLYWLDTNTVDGVAQDFTNKYIILCVPYSLGLSSESDGKPSFGIFDGRAISDEANKMWSFYNGRLQGAYWSIGSATYTNDVDGAGFPYTNVVETADGPFMTYSYTNVIDGISGANIEYVTGELITNELIRVMEVGLTNFLERASGISLTVTHNCPENPGHADPDYGFYENTYTNGTTITISSPEFATNAAENVEFRCVGYLLSSTNTTEVATNLNVTTDSFTPMRDGNYTLTWLWETNAVKVTVDYIFSNSKVSGIVEPGEGWYPTNTVYLFTATGDTPANPMYPPSNFDSWTLNNQFREDDEYVESGNLLVVKIMHPFCITANFKQESSLNTSTFNLKVTNYGTRAGDPVPATRLGGVEIPYDTVTNIPYKTTDAVLEKSYYNEDNSNFQWCRGWMLTGDDGKLLYKLYYDDASNLVCIPTNFNDACTGGGNGGGLLIHGNDVLEERGTKTNVVEEANGFWVYYLSETSPLSYIGINPNFYGITNGASVTLTWLWQLPVEGDITNEFEIVWNDCLNNLYLGYATNLLDGVSMTTKGWTLADITVKAPIGWTAEKSLDADGNVVATLALDTTALSNAMNSCALTIYPKDDGSGKYMVDAAITNALRGFWYVLYGANDLSAAPDSVDSWKAVTPGTYESGTPAGQGGGTAEDPISEVNLSVIVTPGDSGAGAKRFYKVVSGATNNPLDE